MYNVLNKKKRFPLWITMHELLVNGRTAEYGRIQTFLNVGKQ